MHTRAKISLIIFFLTWVGLLQFLFLFEAFNPDFYSTFRDATNCFKYGILTAELVICAILLCSEINHLEEFHIDKFTLVTFILFSFFRSRNIMDQVVVGESYFLILIGLSGVSVIFALIVNKPKLLRSNWRWALLGLFLGALILFPIAQLEASLRQTWFVSSLIKNSVSITAISQTLHNLSTASLPEEILFRGFLWGYLRREGWDEKKIFWGQGILFWLLHFSRIVTPFSFFIFLPLLIYVSSILTSRSKQVFPAILSHTIIDVVSVIYNLGSY